MGWVHRLRPKKGEDKITPPTKSAELKRLKELIYSSPDVRQDMVADLKARIVGGEYKVRTERVAEKVMQHGVYILAALAGNDHRPI